MKVDKNKLVRAQYKLYTVEADGKETLFESTTPERPLEYIHGLGMMIEAFESTLLGLEEGDKFDFILSPEEAYGSRNEEYIQKLPREVFFVDGEFDTDIVFVGAEVPMMTADGQQIIGRVLEISDQEVSMDFNHPLADTTLHFIGQIESISEPTAEEVRELMSPHGGCSSEECGGGCCGCH